MSGEPKYRIYKYEQLHTFGFLKVSYEVYRGHYRRGWFWGGRWNWEHLCTCETQKEADKALADARRMNGQNLVTVVREEP